MRSELRLHRLLLAMLATMLLVFVAVLFYLGMNVASEYFEATVSLVAVIVVGTAFVYMGMAEGIVAFQFGMQHKRELWSYLTLGLISVISGLYLAMSETASCKPSPLLSRLTPFSLGPPNCASLNIWNIIQNRNTCS